MRWNVVFLGLVALGITLPGCTQQCFITEPDRNEYMHLMPANMEHRTDVGLPPTPVNRSVPVTVLNPERELRYLSLSEAIAIALEHGTTGFQTVRIFGQMQEDLFNIQQAQSADLSEDSIRVLALEPAVSYTGIEAALSRHDVLSISNVGWRSTDEPTNGFNSLTNGEGAHVETSLVKPLPTGGVAGLTFSNDYTLLSAPPSNIPITNPSYEPKLQFTFDHPLWQSYGVDINQLLPRLPGPTVSPGSSLSGFAQSFLGEHVGNIPPGFAPGVSLTNGILIARLRFDQNRADLERVVNFLLINVEVAYWNLYSSYVQLFASDQGLRQSHRAWLEAQLRYEAGKASQADVASARGAYEQFRGDRVQALGQVLESERQLRGLIGLPVEDNKQLVPADAPTVAPYSPDYLSALNDALTLRPELVEVRQELKVRQFDVLIQENFLKPDLRFSSAYTLVGFGSRLDSNEQITDPITGSTRSTNAFRVLASDHFNDWTLGLTLNVPLGYRFEHAAVRRAKLSLAQVNLALLREEDKAERFLVKAYRDIYTNYETIGARRSQRLAAAKEVEADFQLYRLGTKTVEFLLDAQRRFAAALAAEYQAITAYNSALATFEFAKGTIMKHDSVFIGEGPLPQCAQVRAVEHERERTVALVAREREHPLHQTEAATEHGPPGMPELPGHESPSLPALYGNAKTMSEITGDLPPVSTAPPGQLRPAQTPPAPPAAAAPASPQRAAVLPEGLGDPLAITTPPAGTGPTLAPGLKW
jgi:outer membrane protein TolC